MLSKSNNMTKKQYQNIKLVVVVIIAIIFSQAIILKNYIIPIIVLLISSLVLMYLRHKVKDVIADERDYAISGKSALLSIQIYSWVAVVSMFILYAFRDINPAYEAIATTLAFSTCILMFLYAIIFRYYEKLKFSDKKLVYSAIILIIFLFLAVATVRLFSGEDNWICKDGQWIKHGNPSFSAPSVECKK